MWAYPLSKTFPKFSYQLYWWGEKGGLGHLHSQKANSIMYDGTGFIIYNQYITILNNSQHFCMAWGQLQDIAKGCLNISLDCSWPHRKISPLSEWMNADELCFAVFFSLWESFHSPFYPRQCCPRPSLCRISSWTSSAWQWPCDGDDDGDNDCTEHCHLRPNHNDWQDVNLGRQGLLSL